MLTWIRVSSPWGTHHPRRSAREMHPSRPPMLAARRSAGSASSRMSQCRRATLTRPSEVCVRIVRIENPAAVASRLCAMPLRAPSHAMSSIVEVCPTRVCSPRPSAHVGKTSSHVAPGEEHLPCPRRGESREMRLISSGSPHAAAFSSSRTRAPGGRGRKPGNCDGEIVICAGFT